jgi:hypothetical protein
MVQIKNPTLVLGLGGTGFHCVSKLKNLIGKEFGTIPTSIKFLCIDFDNADNNKNKYQSLFSEESTLEAHGDDGAEWIKISGGKNIDYEKSIKSPMTHADLDFFESDSEKKENLLRAIGGFDLSVGAGQKRILGKIGISYPTNYNNIKKKIQEVIHPLYTVNIENNANYNKISVYVINSFSGGAGAGMFLDIILTLKLNDLRNADTPFELFTFNFLPDVFLDRFAENIFPGLVEPNTFGAISELEYIYSNVSTFRPTHHKKVIGQNSYLPKVNFLINNQVYGGAKISFKSMIYATSNTMLNLILAGKGMDSQWSNFQGNITGNMRGKSKIFASLGYAEIFFDKKRLKEYTISKVLETAWNDYKAKNMLDVDISGILNIYKNDFKTHLLSEEFKDEFSKSEVSISSTKKTFSKLPTIISDSKELFKKKINDIVEEHYKKNQIKDKVKSVTDQICIGTTNITDRKNAIEKLKVSLNDLKIDENVLAKDLSDFDDNVKLKIDNIVKVPKRYKSLFGWTKSSFFKKYLPQEVKTIKIFIENNKNLFLKQEIYRLINNNIDEAIVFLTEFDPTQINIENLTWITKNINPIKLKSSDDNVILLESYFTKIIDEEITKDTGINKDLIESFLSGNQSFEDSIAHTEPMKKMIELESKNLYELTQLLDSNTRSDIINKLNVLIPPLWDREEESVIGDGKNPDEQLIKFKRLGIPEKTTDMNYFGKGSFGDIKGGDIVPLNNPHLQVFISLELGLAAFSLRCMHRYQAKFQEVIHDNQDCSVQFFAYDEIRKKVLNGTEGIFVYGDDDAKNKRKRAIEAWSFGWATGIFFKQQNRIKVRVSNKFVPSPENLPKLDRRVYDAFRDFGQTADLIKIFNALTADEKLLQDIENQLTEKQNNATDYLTKVSEKFKETSENDKMPKFQTEKKAYSQLNDEEKQLLMEEEETLKSGCEDFANGKGIKILFKEEEDKEGNIYERMEVL